MLDSLTTHSVTGVLSERRWRIKKLLIAASLEVSFLCSLHKVRGPGDYVFRPPNCLGSQICMIKRAYVITLVGASAKKILEKEV